MRVLLDVAIVAVVANLVTDIYEYALERFLGKTRDWHLVGRWVANIAEGSLSLDPNDETRAVSGELALGWVFHYAVALFYASVYLFGVWHVLGEPPSLGTALAFGVVTVAAAWFVLMPGLGAGVFATKAARPNFARAASLSVHAVFGFGLYLGCRIAGLV